VLLSNLKYAFRIATHLGGSYPRTCPGCAFSGKFRAFGLPPRFDAQCPRCLSLERHRLFFLTAESQELIRRSTDVLHVAPELVVQRFLQSRCKRYTTLDLFRSDVDVKEPIENTTLPDESYDHVVCSHVLEHVDDAKALKEIFRLLKRGGTLVTMVPIIEGWEKTYEDFSITSPEERELHFGQDDHIRYYGRDFRDRLARAGFSVKEFTAEGPDVVKFGLLAGEKVFVAAKG
jgi:SAM-dependent methyltransferase